MKKLLLSCAMACFAFASFAQNVITFTAGVDKSESDQASDNVSISKDGVTITISNGILGRTDNYRCYKGQTLTVSSTVGEISNISFTCTASGDEKYGPGNFTDPTSGTYTYEGTSGTWTGSASEVTMTASANQVRMTEINVTVGTSGTYVPKPVITPASGTYYGAQTVTITAAEGCKIFYGGASPADVTEEYTAPFTLTQPGSYEIYAYAEDANGNQSDRATSTIEIADITSYSTISALREACTATAEADAPTVRFNFDGLLVTGVKNANLFVTDGTSSYLLYGSSNFHKGDKISGHVDGKLYQYNKLGELKVTDSYANVQVTSSDNAVTAKVAQITDVIDEYSSYESTYVCFENVTLGSEMFENRNLTISDEDGNEINIYDTAKMFTESTFDNSKVYNVYCYVARYKDTVQVYVIDENDIREAATDGIANITTPADATLYNITGQKVQGTFHGVVIENGKKVIK